MKIITRINPNEKNNTEPEYPCVMQCVNGLAVLFESRGRGVVIFQGGSLQKVGEYNREWFMDAFKPFYGTVTIESSPS